MSGAAASAGATILGTGFQVGSALFGGNAEASAAKDAANRQAALSAIDSQRSLLEAVRLQNESDMEEEWSSYVSEREAQWIEAWTPVQVAYTKLFGNYAKISALQDGESAAEYTVDSALLQVGFLRDLSLKKAELTNLMAEGQALLVEAQGEAKTAGIAAERKAALDDLKQEADKAEGQVRASMAAQGREMTGSALDVLQAKEDTARKKQAYITLKAASEISTTDLEARGEASSIRQKGHAQAWETISDAYSQGVTALSAAEMKNRAIRESMDLKLGQIDSELSYKVLSMETEAERSAFLTREEGWRTVTNLERQTQNEIWGLQYDMMDSIFAGQTSSQAAEKYSDMESSANFAKAGSSLLKGIPTIYDAGVKAEWWK